MFSTPVLFLIFNRPDTTAKVFAQIRRQKPKYLFIAADGPRNNHPDDTGLCNQCRQIATAIDWDCEVKTLFRDKNLGCSKAPATGITWFFEQVEAGMILEDDCIPGDSFFTFCETLLIKYKNDERVMHITASNLNDAVKFGSGSYYYSNYANVWGWATWRRAWNKYDFEMHDKAAYLKLIDDTFTCFSERVFWRSRIMLIRSKLIDTWDYQWMFSIWKAGGVCLSSNYNLVTNIGFGDPAATHTSGKSLYVTPGISHIQEINHPSVLKIDKKAETAFISSLHGIKRRGHFMYYLHHYFIQRCLNLRHKVKLMINKNALKKTAHEK